MREFIIKPVRSRENVMASLRGNWNYPTAVRFGPGRIAELPEAFRQLQRHLHGRSGGDREMVEILSLVLQHDEQAVLAAVEMALQAGAATKTHILNLLHRLTDGAASRVPPIEAPQALMLAQEPKANIARYDSLRTRQGGRDAS